MTLFLCELMIIQHRIIAEKIMEKIHFNAEQICLKNVP